jgi:hypothetical protein
MKRYQINEAELKFLKEMIEYLNTEGNSMTEQGSNQCNQVFDRILSRPVLDLIIDSKAIEEELKKSEESIYND